MLTIYDVGGVVLKDRILIDIDHEHFGAIPLTSNTFQLLFHLIINDESTAVFEEILDMQISIFKAGSYVKLKLNNSNDKLIKKTTLSRIEFLSLLISIAVQTRHIEGCSYKDIFIDEVKEAAKTDKEISEIWKTLENF